MGRYFPVCSLKIFDFFPSKNQPFFRSATAGLGKSSTARATKVRELQRNLPDNSGGKKGFLV